MRWKRQAIENLAKTFDDKDSDVQAGREAQGIIEGRNARHRRSRPDTARSQQQADRRVPLGNHSDTAVERRYAGQDVAPPLLL